MAHREDSVLEPFAQPDEAESRQKAMPSHGSSPSVSPMPAWPVTERGSGILDEKSFQRMIATERKRTERSGQPFLLLLLDAGNCLSSDTDGTVLQAVLSVLSLGSRETDVTGWYKDHSVVGVLFTEIERASALSTMVSRVSETLRLNLTPQNFNQINISVHLFPEDWNQESSPAIPALYPDLAHREKTQRAALAIKRGMDIVGSLIAIVLFAPLFLLAAAVVKLGSKGPILFRQERIGQFGKPFTFLKFRSMYANNDPRIHREFMKRVISGSHEKGSKMTDDPRITPVGRFLRRSSLDELPQFFSVLKGDMSLVGPRPPLAYECHEYELWHRRRVLEVKPGLTGLWQVKGRSRVRFDDMVRLDLQYVRTWSLWLDIQILLKTPVAILFGGDAY
jgi:lipopolysaccharide/colanic/teichoic acid biosynthesis glycosyltransferase